MSAAMFSGSPAGLTPLRTGESSIPAGAPLIAVPDTAITTNSIVFCCAGDVADATAVVFCVGALTPGVGFTIRANANATNPTPIRWAVLRY